MKIKDINIKIIQDSRGKDTLEAVMSAELSGLKRGTDAERRGSFSVKASVPSGKSTGSHEVFVLEPKKALEKFEEINGKILADDFNSQEEFDNFLIALDGTPNKQNLGGNLILALSLAFARLKAKSQGKELWEYIRLTYNQKPITNNYNFPKPIFNVINGGLHSGLPHSSASVLRSSAPPAGGLSFQEFQVIPQVSDFGMALSMGREFYRKLQEELENKFGKENIFLGDEAGFSAPFETNEEAIEILFNLIKKNNYPLRIGLDAAATSFWKNAEQRGIEDAERRGSGVYLVDGKEYSSDDLMEYYLRLIENYGIISLEDPFYEEAFENFAELTRAVGGAGAKKEDVLVITDDLTTTNPQRLQKAIDEKSGNAILIKPNQIGTLTETLKVVELAYKNNWKCVVSHRSGETMDDFIADLAYAIGAWGIKAGAPGKPERMAKYDRLLEIYKNR